ncbi:MAG: hypothetical protein IIY69_03520 [Clostridia bacterium]|nr:hypothetical protein [Clostridia bacterium]
MPKQKKYDTNTLYFRKQVRDKIKKIPEFPVTYVSAPSGFGKTVALKDFFDRLADARVFFITVSDYYPQEAWSKFCLAIQKFDKTSGELLLRIGCPTEDTLEDALKIIDTVYCPDEMYIIMDNYELLNPHIPGEVISAFADHNAGGLHIVLISRNKDVGFSESTSNILWISREDFEFRTDDIKAYFSRVGARISEEEAQALYDTTGGMAAAVHLNLLILIKTNAVANVSDMRELVRTALFDPLTDEVKDRLIICSFFDFFTLPQATEVLGINVPVESPEEIFGENTLVRFDDDRGIVLFHNFLRDALNGEFLKRDADFRRRVVQTVGDWYREHDELIPIVKLCIRAGEHEMALDAIAECGTLIIERFHDPVISGFIKQVDKKVLNSNPEAMSVIAMAHYSLNEFFEYYQMIERIKSVLDSGSLSKEVAHYVSGMYYMLEAFARFNRIDEMAEYHARGYVLLGDKAKTMVGTGRLWTGGAISVLYMFHREPGLLNQTIDELERMLETYYLLSNNHGYPAELVMRSEAMFLRGDYESAYAVAKQAYSLAESHGMKEIMLAAAFLLSRTTFMRGDGEQMYKIILNLEVDIIETPVDAQLYPSIKLCQAWANMRYGYFDSIPEWIKEGRYGKHLNFIAQPCADIVFGACLIFSGQHRRYLENFNKIMRRASYFPTVMAQIYAYVHAAIAHERLGHKKEAEEMLGSAIDIAIPDRIYLPFVEYGDRVLSILDRVELSEEHKEKIRELVADGIESYKKTVAMLKKLGVGLTKREYEVAYFASKGLNNREIAQRLSISQSTVKRELERIYEKGGIESRVQLPAMLLRNKPYDYRGKTY